MLSWFEVENFKSIKKLHLDFSPFMVFVGPNGAGKTNIVQALALFLDILAAGTTEPIELYGGYEQLIRRQKKPARAGMRFALRFPILALSGPNFTPAETDPSLVVQVDVTVRPGSNSGNLRVTREIIQFDDGSDLPFRLRSTDGDGPSIEPSGNSRIMDWLSFLMRGRTAHDFAEWYGLRAKHARHHLIMATSFLRDWVVIQALPSVIRLRLDASALRSDSRLDAPRPSSPLGRRGEDLALALERMQQRKAITRQGYARVLEGLRSVYPRIEDVSTIHYQPGRVALSFKERSIEGSLGEANISDGVMHALALLMALEGTPESSVLAIEEPENALHPWALQKIIEHAQECLPRAEPILLTTHSPIVVDAAKDPASLFIVENTEKQGTMVTPALQKEAALRSILANSGQTLGDVWLDGTLGGVPGADL